VNERKVITLDRTLYRTTYRPKIQIYRAACARELAEDAAYNHQDRWIKP
jgi:hypothetical protein